MSDAAGYVQPAAAPDPRLHAVDCKADGLALPVPDFSTLSRRGIGLKVAQRGRAPDKPITLIVDSTALKVHSEVGWNGRKRGAKGARKTW